ncbi:hypothetical protein [Haladaptatus litoreus]|nr:hypothetical protein [Haladaptatus litoreus]
MIERSIEIQNEMTKSFAKAAESQKSAQEKGVDAWKSAIETSLNVVDATTPTDSTAFTDMQETIDNQFDTLNDIHTDVWESTERNIEAGADISEDMNEIFLSFVNDSVEMAMKTNKQFEERSETVVDATEVETQ